MRKNSKIENVFEIAGPSKSMRIDTDNGVLRGVKILGNQSGNGRYYSRDVLTKAAPLYDNKAVNINHGDHPGDRRDYSDRIGILKNVKVQEDGLYGDLFYNPKHERASQLAWDAEHAANNVGFSHDAKCRTHRRNGVTIVEEILSVNSVDLVGEPATTAGLFESQQERKPMKTTIGQIVADHPKAKGAARVRQLCEQDALGAPDVAIADMPVEVPAEASADEAIKAAFIAAVMAVVQDDSLDVAAMMAKIKGLLVAKEKVTGEGAAAATATPEQDDDGEPKEKKDEETKEQINRLERKVEVSELLRKKGASVTEEVFEALCREPNSRAREKLLEQFGGNGSTRAQRPRSTGGSKLQEQKAPREVTDSKDWAKSIC